MIEEKKTVTVLTTINPPDYRVSKWFDITKNNSIIVGDNKTPLNWKFEKCTYYSILEQKNSEFRIGQKLPENHYTRKNIGYLYALQAGASQIIDTDDDNFPYNGIWNTLLSNSFNFKELHSSQEKTYKNIYSYFSNMAPAFWPRGFPLDALLKESATINEEELTIKEKNENIALWQCMVDGDPDIDAIHRLIFRETPSFQKKPALLYSRNNFCPFNSQNTQRRKKSIFPLLYLPSTVSFRFTDILRGYVAQTIMHSKGIKWGFFQSSALQERNKHDIMKDFHSETVMYNEMNKIIDLLNSSVRSTASIEDNLFCCYEILEKKRIVQMNELHLIELWLKDLSSI